MFPGQNYDISQAPRLSGRGQNGDVEDLDYGRPLPPEEIVSQCVQQGIKSIGQYAACATLRLSYSQTAMNPH